MKHPASVLQLTLAGVVFAILWSSAASATKIGLQFAQPFVISVIRFFLAAVLMLFIAHVVLRQKIPAPGDYKKLAIYGLLNISIYLGTYIVAMQYVSAGIGSLFIATNPVFISLIASLWLKKPVPPSTIMSLFVCSAGILIAAYPLFSSSHITPAGLILLLIAMFTYSLSSLYFSRQSWNGMHIFTINGWQTLFGGIFLLPLLLLTYRSSENVFNLRLWGSVLWLAIPVSIIAVQLWLFLLKDNPVKAAFWLFLCPISGFIIAACIMREPISLYTFAGVALVLSGLYLVQKYRKA